MGPTSPSSIHVSLSPLSLPPCFVTLQFHHFKYSSNGCVHFYFFCTIFGLMFRTWSNSVMSVAGFCPIHAPGLRAIWTVCSLMPCCLSPELWHPQHHRLWQHHPASEQRPQELQRVRRLLKRKVMADALVSLKTVGQDAPCKTRNNLFFLVVLISSEALVL
jgi:hypothetical protein